LKAKKFDQVLSTFVAQRSSMSGIQLSMMFNIMGKSPSEHFKLKRDPHFQAFVQHVTLKLKTPNFFDVQGTANIIHAVAKMKLNLPELVLLIKERADWLVAEGKPQEVANTVWAFATLGHHSPQLMAAVEKRAAWLVAEGTPQGVANTVWAFATLGYHSPQLMAAVEKRAAWLIDKGTPQSVANAIWAFAVLGLDHSNTSQVSAVSAMWLSLISMNSLNSCLSREYVRQLVHFLVACRVEAPGIKLADPSIEILQLMKAATSDSCVKVSDAQTEVRQLLLKLDISTEMEVSPFEDEMGTFLSIDMACRKKMLAVEFDGPSHFLSNGDHNGATKFKTRLLKKLGWHVVRIPVGEWKKLKSSAEKVDYLRKKTQSTAFVK